MSRGMFHGDVPENPPIIAASDRDSVFCTEFACLFLGDTDKIRFLNFPENDLLRIQGNLQSLWTRGIQDVRSYGTAHEVKLRGNPWRSSASGQNLIEGRQMLCGLLQGLSDMGWVLSQTTSICRTAVEKGTVCEILEIDLLVTVQQLH